VTLANVFLHCVIVGLRGDVVHLPSTTVRVIPHWLRTREASGPLRRSIWCCRNDPPKSSLVAFFGELDACLKTWPTHIRFQNKFTPIKRSISDDMWNHGSAKRMLRGRLNLFRPKENVGILPAIQSVTIHSIAAVYELSRDCNLIPTTWLVEITCRWHRRSRDLIDA